MALTDFDRLLIGRCLDRLPGAWKDFVDRYVSLFCHVVTHSAAARSVSLSDPDREDIVSEVFAEVIRDDFRVLRRFREQSALGTYLAVIARRVAVREIVKRRKQEFAEAAAAEKVARSAAEQVRSGTVIIEDAEEIEALLQRLPDRDAELLRQYHLEGRSYREIGEQFDLSENSVGAALSRARETLASLQVN